jgi:putative tricarboxylic transport membrane protein
MTGRVVALVMLVTSTIYLVHALRMPLGGAARPGPGFYPVAVGAFACIVALVITALAFRRFALGETVEAEEPGPTERRHVWLTVGTLAGFCLLMPWTGYPLAALLFVGTLLLELGAGWPRALVAGLISAEGSYYLFAIVLGVSLPRGLWPH